MAAHLNEPQPPALDALRQAIREHGEWPENRAVTRLLHALELTGGARHRAVALGVALVEGARARRDDCRIKKALRSCASPKRCCAFPMTRPPIV